MQLGDGARQVGVAFELGFQDVKSGQNVRGGAVRAVMLPVAVEWRKAEDKSIGSRR